MEHPACINVGAKQCAVSKEQGHRVIRCLGQDYYVIGWYFGRGRRWGELHYVLVRHIPLGASKELTKSA